MIVPVAQILTKKIPAIFLYNFIRISKDFINLGLGRYLLLIHHPTNCIPY